MQTITGTINKALEYKAIVQEKEATPTKEIQEITPDEGYDGISKMTIKKITDEYIIPTGSVEITSNGTHDVTDKASAIVKVAEKKLGTKSISQTGVKTVTYNASDDNLDGYSKVDITTSGVDINEYFSNTIEGDYFGYKGWKVNLLKWRSPLIINGYSLDYAFKDYPLNELPELIGMNNVTSMNNTFSNSSIVTIPLLDTSNVTKMNNIFSSCKSLTTIPQLNTQKVESIERGFNECEKLTELPELDFSSMKKMQSGYNYYLFYNCTKLKTIGGFLNLGMNYDTTESANKMEYRLALITTEYASGTPLDLTKQSLINVLNKLYDIATKGCNAQQVIIGSTNIAKLTSEEIAIATNKGWTVS